MDEQLQKLLNAIEEAEEAKRQFVKANPKGEGDRKQRLALYNEVERARKALRDYKRFNPQLYP